MRIDHDARIDFDREECAQIRNDAEVMADFAQLVNDATGRRDRDYVISAAERRTLHRVAEMHTRIVNITRGDLWVKENTDGK